MGRPVADPVVEHRSDQWVGLYGGIERIDKVGDVVPAGDIVFNGVHTGSVPKVAEAPALVNGRITTPVVYMMKEMGPVKYLILCKKWHYGELFTHDGLSRAVMARGHCFYTC